ncbi:MAG: thiamine diphosphokinase [Treponema sp.]|nr:thiamine diphosphokinase [Treponema sp.]
MENPIGNCLIVAGGKESKIPHNDGDFVIACDKGLEYCLKQGIRPDIAVGDFDSFSGEIPCNLFVEKLPREKDDTDTMHAVKKAIALGYTSFTLTCCLGNRLDHAFCNIQTLSFIKSQGLDAKIIEDDEELFIIQNETRNIPPKDGFSLSVFSLSKKSKGVFIEGAKYNVSNFCFLADVPMGVSNEWQGNCTIKVRKGRLLVILSRLSLS